MAITAPSTLPAPVVTATHLRLVLGRCGAVVVQDDAGRVRALPALTEDQADDVELVVLVEHEGAVDYLREAEGRHAEAAAALTMDLAGQHARGLL